MINKLAAIAKSYDRTIDFGKKGINLYNNLPSYITNDPDYLKWKTELENTTKSNSLKLITSYLLPAKNMEFIDLGCSLNLIFNGYDKWPSTYNGVDISQKTIQLLNKFVDEKKLQIGQLLCTSVHKTPFNNNHFDIGACIGVLEYYDKYFVQIIIKEAHRIIKPNGKLVLDIPNIKSQSGRIMMLIEEYMGRPDKFNLLPHQFENMIKKYFEIEETDSTVAELNNMGILYKLKCKK